jgi:hypothetical protein
MNLVNKPAVSALNLSEIFSNQETYSVPVYQRDYAWASAQVQDLWDDLFEFFTDQEEQYLLGQVIVATSAEPGTKWDLVDGQQRLTTLSLLFLVLRKLADSFEHPSDDEITALLESSLVETEGEPRLRVARDARMSYGAMLNKEFIYRDKSISGEHLVENFNLLYALASAELKNPKSLSAFANTLFRNVWIMRVEMPKDEQAIEFFERTNDRGLDLNSADLLKNLLFAEVGDRSFYKEIDKSWTESAKTMKQVQIRRISTMGYLMKALVSARVGKHTSNKKVFRAWREILKGNKPEVLKLLIELPLKSMQLLNISAGKTPDGAEPDNLQALSLNSIVQHYLVLLAGAHLDRDGYRYLCQIVESRSLLSLLAKERNGAFEQGLTPWARNLSALAANASPDEIFSAAAPALQDLSPLLESLDFQIRNLDYERGPSDRDKIRSVLGISAREVGAFQASKQFPNVLSEYVSSRFDIEHIEPKSTINRITWGDPSDTRYVNSIGNLTLVYKSDNRGAGDAKPALKAGIYAQSEVLATKLLCDIAQIGTIEPTLKKLLEKHDLTGNGRLSLWNESAALCRENLYCELVINRFRQDLRIS